MTNISGSCLMKTVWAISHENMSSGIFDQVRFKPACSATETSKNLECWDKAGIHIILSKQRRTKVLIRLRGCAGWSAPLLFAYGIKQFSHDLAHLMDESYTWSVGSVGNKPHKTYLNPKVSWNLATGSAGWLRSCFFSTIKWPVDQHWLYNECIIWNVQFQ